VVTRRALLGAGAVALLDGCGPEEEPEVDATAVLEEQLRVTQRVVVAYEGVGGEGRANAEARVERLEAALGHLLQDTTAGGATGALAAAGAEQVALRSYVAAVGQLEDPAYRELLAGLIADAASSESALLTTLKRPAAPSAFPGQPV
jgi:hypothetical protein